MMEWEVKNIIRENLRLEGEIKTLKKEVETLNNKLLTELQDHLKTQFKLVEKITELTELKTLKDIKL